MHKVTKKLWIPSYPAYLTSAATGGGGGPTTLYTESPTLSGADPNGSTTFRIAVPITGTTGTQIRATFRPGVSESLTVLNASFAKRNLAEPVYADATATPIELLFGGVSGFTAATTDMTSDWTNLSGLSLTTGDEALVIFDVGTGSTRIAFAGSSTGVTTFYRSSSATWNEIAPRPINTVNSTNYGIVSVETQ